MKIQGFPTKDHSQSKSLYIILPQEWVNIIGGLQRKQRMSWYINNNHDLVIKKPESDALTFENGGS